MAYKIDNTPAVCLDCLFISWLTSEDLQTLVLPPVPLGTGFYASHACILLFILQQFTLMVTSN